jgi:hypothetical protein
MIEQLTEHNFSLYAATYYDNPNCTDILEFYEDLNRIKYIKRLFKKYEDTGDLKERLVLNHLITFYNVFDSRGGTKMLIFKLHEHLQYLKPFLVLLNYWPEKIDGIEGLNILDDDIKMDENIVKVLRGI